jgi:hypothetical protein
MEIQDFVYLVAILFVLMLFMSSLSTGRRRRRKRRSSTMVQPMTQLAEDSAPTADLAPEDGVAVQMENDATEASSTGDDGDTTIPSSTA